VVGEIVRREANSAGVRFGVHVVGDPQEVFSPGASDHAFRPVFRWLFSRQLRIACRQGSAVGYVSRHVLPERYPAAAEAPTFTFSNVVLKQAVLSDDEALQRSERLRAPKPEFHLGTIASLQVPYKGVDVLLRAMAQCAALGLNLRLTVVGEGTLRQAMEKLAAELGIGQRVEFLGQLKAGAAIYGFLDSVDLYVQPSRTEGLPRALIEAMARGCPAVASRVGGIPELLDSGQMVAPDQPAELAERIAETLRQPERLAAMSRSNVTKARAYEFSEIQRSREGFLRAIAGETERALAVCAE
jgi:glycosyltransferase involved in cell wall biosynthesis